MTMSSTIKWQVMVRGMGASIITLNVAENQQDFMATTVAHFRELIHNERSHVSAAPEEMRILYSGKQLSDKLPKGGESTLGDYKIHRNSTLQVVFRVPGGQDSPRGIKQRVPRPLDVEKTPNMTDPYLQSRFTNSEPDAIMGFSCDDDQPRIKMSCGHAVDVNNLTTYCKNQIDQHDTEFFCPAIVGSGTQKCGKEWSYEEVRRAAHLTPEEEIYFESMLSEQGAIQLCDFKECPGCNSFVERKDLTNLRVNCTFCSKVRTYDFCWNCKSEWSGPTTSAVKCGNSKCEHADMPSIQKAPMVILHGNQVPCRRACPTCGLVVEHSLQRCKMLICPRCKKEFCFLCVKLKKNCLATAPGSYYGNCSEPPAPRQTEIPVWSK